MRSTQMLQQENQTIKGRLSGAELCHTGTFIDQAYSNVVVFVKDTPLDEWQEKNMCRED